MEGMSHESRRGTLGQEGEEESSFNKRLNSHLQNQVKEAHLKLYLVPYRKLTTSRHKT